MLRPSHETAPFLLLLRLLPWPSPFRSTSFLTDSVLPRAGFRGAILAETGLAGVEWEHADLRDVDFTNASFHMGSSRSGLVNSPIASEGTRTGFYTDDSAELDFKAPEEIRKANLRGADLRQAKVMETDWYLVDLRDAFYTPEQGEHFKRCRAILFDRGHVTANLRNPGAGRARGMDSRTRSTLPPTSLETPPCRDLPSSLSAPFLRSRSSHRKPASRRGSATC